MNATSPCTLKYMEKYWKDYQGNDEDFWEHEFGKHGTCMSTLEPSCYDNYTPGKEASDFFKRTVRLFKTLPSYEWLAEAGIVPSTTARYTLAAIQAALKAKFGHNAIVNCNRNQELDELWYHFNVRGSIQFGEFVPVDPVGSPSTCPATGIKYLPKYQTTTTTPTSMSVTATSTGATASPTAAPSGSPTVLNGRGTFNVVSPNVPPSQTGGFLISGGNWYRNGGTPATYTATPNPDGLTFTLTTSKGNCGIVGTSLSCGTGVTTPSSFGYDGTYLTYSGLSTFYAAAVPTGTVQGTVYTIPMAVSLQATWVGK